MLRGSPPVRFVRFTAFRCAVAVLAGFLLCHCAAPRVTRIAPVLDPSHTFWTARDGKKLPCKHWPGEPKNPRAVVICVHGLSGAASDFWPVGEGFPPKGYAVYAVELRGQGRDPDLRYRGDIWSSRQWRQDLLDFTALVRKQNPGAPVFWLGESLGALITIDATAAVSESSLEPAGIILASPVVALRPALKLPFFKNLAVRSLLRFLPGKRISLEAIGNSEVRVTSHTTHRQQMEQTEHYVKDFTVRLFGQIERLIKGTGDAAARIRVPVLVFYTPNDPLTPHESVERFVSRLSSPDKTPVFFAESFHLIFHDRDRAEALARLSSWLGEHSSNARKPGAENLGGS